ncbi:MAG TPA: hypothetical protein VKR56_08905 [Candidatus Cybelea sp.]|nr:hypothetical protein [Candidatus Cybelea sp.]
MRRRGDEVLEVAVGYAAGPAGSGVAYAALNGAAEGREVVRLPFRIVRRCALMERAVAYAALVTVARALCKRGVTRAHFVMPDRQLVQEATTRDVPEALVLPYVRLRCALNAFDDVEIGLGATDELMQRAGAEVALNVAA